MGPAVAATGEETGMAFFRADVKCYHCGRVSGTVTGRQGASIQECVFTGRGVPSGASTPPGRIVCAHCGGPVFLDEVEILAARPLAEIARREREVA
jgi:hypothetical protein